MSRLTATVPERAATGLRRVLELIAGGRLAPEVTPVAGLADVPAVHQLLAEGRGSGKYVVALG
jgi:NADPH2:quinone reductase